VPRIEAAAGTLLKNVNIFAGQSEPVALSDAEYPYWLKLEADRPAKLDPGRFKRLGVLPTRTELRLLNKARIRQSNEERGA